MYEIRKPSKDYSTIKAVFWIAVVMILIGLIGGKERESIERAIELV